MSRASDPHVSSALKHLRFGVTGAGVVLALCLAAQMLVWGFIHFTDVRHQVLKADETAAQPLTVVNSKGSVIKLEVAPSETAVEVNRVEGPGSLVLARLNEIIQTVGVMSAVVLFVLLFQGVVVAGGGQVPGVEQVVTAGTWGLVLGLLSLPWSGVLPAMSFPGVFQGYGGMVAESDAYRAGSSESMGAMGFYGLHLLLPVLMMGGAGAIVVRFRAGIEQGIIVTHASQLDEKLEREIRERKLGELSQPRAVGALNQAIGMTTGVGDRTAGGSGLSAAPPPPPAAAPARSPMSSRPSGEEPPPGVGPGSPRRPI